MDFELSPTRKGGNIHQNRQKRQARFGRYVDDSICMDILNKYDINQRSRGFRCEKMEGFLVGMRSVDVSIAKTIDSLLLIKKRPNISGDFCPEH